MASWMKLAVRIVLGVTAVLYVIVVLIALVGTVRCFVVGGWSGPC